MNRLDGKVALVSGAARGIGAETARQMAKAGATVVVGDILEERARETVKDIVDAGGKALFVKLDVTSEASWAAAVAVAASISSSTMPACFSAATSWKPRSRTGTSWSPST